MKERELADLFGGSATRNSEEDNNDNNNVNDNVNVNKNINANDNGNNNPEVPKVKKTEVKKKANEDILELLKDNNDKKVVGFHLDKDVRDAFQKVLGKKPPRGAQSKLANKIFRDFFEERGLL
ncbi:hypothetical protein [Bacillus cereus]|uniref:hypothetical protein n=1 Tax=Bacillus cereus TaxID=1396 RepID=UPI00156B9359|nr:hypothetical protein [Bacillus cereus]UDV85419.1 hypothetical protein HQJ03_029130 [Bacillus cereus]UDV90963.1 hypothetical protein HQG80_029115 [Bacillus cereus]